MSPTLKFLYAIHLLAGLITFYGLSTIASLDVLAAIFRIANAVAPSRGDSLQEEYAESRVAEMVGSD